MTLYESIEEVIAAGKKYTVIYADPPWKHHYWGKDNQNRAAANHYNVMELDRLAAMPVADIAADNCRLVMWVTWPHLYESERVVSGWGFKYSTDAFVWVKTSSSRIRAPRMGMGQFTRVCTEFSVTAIRGSPPVMDHGIDDVIYEDPKRHSQKPKRVYGLLDRLCGPGPKIELFCRGMPAAGWDAMGNEVAKGQETL